MYVLIKKTYIWFWKICTYGFKNMVSIMYVSNTYNLKKITCRWGWTTINGRWWKHIDGRKGPNGWMLTNVTHKLMDVGQNYNKQRRTVTLVKLWRTMLDGDYNKWWWHWMATMIMTTLDNDYDGDGAGWQWHLMATVTTMTMVVKQQLRWWQHHKIICVCELSNDGM
jgi:hypothetical protein